ncbi:response regulator [Sporosarcina sp. BI001-red]|uniref:response regulator transcription factor n=1 Tax=Sporosarcina sp. BI001-red TaxID=2282866 RepID=UPI000E27C7A9|nr:response regulator [Sporosarcina sp. BI001-red]REB07142.1 response regulator [Sporosarcina sp. BI001-red]
MYTLLVVDDEPILIRGIRSFVDFDALSITEVLEATNGEEALELFKTHLPDLILADINMPKMNGLDFASAAKALKPDVKIAMITGYDYFDYAVAALKAGVDDYVLKPVSKKDIQELLQKLIGKAQEAHRQQEVTKLVDGLIQSTDSGDETTSYKYKIQQEITANIDNIEFSLATLASTLALSPSYVSTLFKQLFGTTFQQYMITVRLDRAKLLLLSTEMKMYEIAASVGFEDPNYFSAAFKKRFSLSPNQFKEKSRE